MASDYVAMARSLDWDGLERLWRMIEARETPGWIPGKAFEHLILRSFELSGSRVIWPYGVPMNGAIVEQIDGMVIYDHFTCLIEAKDERDPINVEPIAKLRNQLLRRPSGVLGSVFSYSGFTAPARTLAQYTSPQAILLWNGREVDSLIKTREFKAALARKFEYMVQMGEPDFDIRADSAMEAVQ
jgi:hypothetical protein